MSSNVTLFFNNWRGHGNDVGELVVPVLAKSLDDVLSKATLVPLALALRSPADKRGLEGVDDVVFRGVARRFEMEDDE